MDRSVLIGYSRLGYLARRNQWNPADPTPQALRGRTAVVTGANSGLGKATVAGLGRLGARVLMVVRDRAKGERAAAEIRATHPDANLHVEVCDISSLDSVRLFAGQLVAAGTPVDVLVHNAGLLPAERIETVQRHEITLATHVLGPLLLTDLLRPLLRRSSARARVILVSSGGMYTQRIPVDDPEYRVGRYRGATAYARTKRMQVAFTPLLADRLSADGVLVSSMHPGWADTPGIARSLPGFSRLVRPLLRTAAQGADTVVWLASTHPAPASGLFWHDRRARPDQLLPWTRHPAVEVVRLWEYCLDAAGIDR